MFIYGYNICKRDDVEINCVYMDHSIHALHRRIAHYLICIRYINATT